MPALRKFYGFVFLTVLAGCLSSQEIDQQSIDRVIEDLYSAVQKHYVYQGKIESLISRLEQNRRNGAYTSIADNAGLASHLTDDLIEITQDLHFAMIYDPAGVAQLRNAGGKTQKASSEQTEKQFLKESNFGFRNIRLLEGNVAYIRFDYFPNPEYSFDIGSAAMKFVEHADALIFDMRYNRGGHNQFGQFISSYLFSGEDDRLLMKYRYMENGEMIDGSYRTLPVLPGPRMPEKPVYVLTSSTTFSAGEWFPYVLSKLDRAIVVGQVTAGASHAVERVPIDEDFMLQLPVGWVRDPVDDSDFEGVGVAPDHIVPSNLALHVAHKLILEQFAETGDAAKEELSWWLPVLETRIKPVEMSAAQLRRFVGDYEGRTIEQIDNTLVYRWRGRFNLALHSLSPNLFALEGSEDFRFRFIEHGDQVVAIERVERNGNITRYSRLQN